MKLVLRLTLLVTALAVGVWLWTVFFPGPEKIIRRQLDGVARCASFAANEGPLARANNVAKLAGYFSPDAQLNLDVPGRGPHSLTGRDEITQAAMAARAAFTTLTVDFPDIIVRLDADKQSAAVELTARGKIPSEKDYFVQEMKFVFRKLNGEWLIVRVESVKTFSKQLPLPTEGHRVLFAHKARSLISFA